MFAKIFVLIAIALGPEDSVMSYHGGSFETPDQCQKAAEVLRKAADARGIKHDSMVSLCVGTPWNVPGQRGA